MIGIVATLLASIAGAIDQGAAEQGRATPAGVGACTLPAGWGEVARSKPRFVVFGEMHGTWEAPALVGDVACALAAKGRRVLVAIEHNASHDPAFQAAWRLPPARFETAVLAAGWAERDDGVGSKAMLEMVVRLHRAKDAGQPIAVVAFSGVRDEAQRRRLGAMSFTARHEAAQAVNIAAAAASGQYDDVIVLAGNVHASKRPVTNGGETYQPMAMRLAAFGRVVSLNMETAGGMLWACIPRPDFVFVAGKPMPKDAISCGAYPVEANSYSGPARSISLAPAAKEKGDEGYDGVFRLGRITASPPAVMRPS